ncbi:MAG: heme o synthase [Holophagales bacterium]|nr:heme o synthase [Holophagales bacterium]
MSTPRVSSGPPPAAPARAERTASNAAAKETRPTSFSHDLSALAKPRITLMVVLTTAVGYVVATPMFEAWTLLHTLFGTALLSTGSSILNQVLERHSDRAMRRTANRPLAAGRLRPLPALVAGLAVSFAGAAHLYVFVNPLTCWVGVATLLLYVLVYTPMKRVSSLSTLVGAVPGAMPPMMGCTAATGELGALAWALFGILFLWQMPHFLAIAWLYRNDYERGGFPLLTVGDLEGRRTFRQMVFYAAALMPVSLMPSVLGFSGVAYLVGALVLGLAFLWASLQFGRTQDARTARQLLLASVVYLPCVLLLMVFDRTAL